MKKIIAAVCVAVSAISLAAQRQQPQEPAPSPDDYVRSEAMIPMRDGVKLYTVILRPTDSEAAGPALPFLLTRTPYGVASSSARMVKATKPELAASGYIFVYQDIRGRYGSEGTFVMNHPIVEHKTKADVDETTDTRDSIDWLLKNVPNNSGKVGVLGISYPGFLAMMAGIDAHPAVRAISPQAPMTNIWMGDDFFHNGAFRETYGFDYVQQLEAQKTDVAQSSKEDQFDFFLSHVNFAGAAKSAGMTGLPTAKVFLAEPSYVKFWQDMAVEPHLHAPEVPTLEVGGYWDQEDMWGTQAEYAALRKGEESRLANCMGSQVGPAPSVCENSSRVFMVLGPWNHGGWSRGPGDSLGSPLGEKSAQGLPGYGEVTFGGQKTGEYYRTKIEAPFFEFYLKGKPGFYAKEDTTSFRTGENKWHRYSVWPPVDGILNQKAYLAANQSISFTAPASKTASATYVADPANPIPYRHRPIQSTYGQESTWRTWLVEDQRFVSGRKDLANFSTPALADELTVTGDVVTDLFAATTGSDADWIVKLIDVYPDDPSLGKQSGYQLMVAEEILRGRYRNSFTAPEPVKPNQPTEYKWSLHGVDHTFLPGHKLMVEVQSSWFPLYDRNPQTWVPNIMSAPASAYQAETITILPASHLDLPIAEGSKLP